MRTTCEDNLFLIQRAGIREVCERSYAERNRNYTQMEFRDRRILRDLYQGNRICDLILKYNLEPSRIHFIVGRYTAIAKKLLDERRGAAG